jgi:hypothetical protein
MSRSSRHEEQHSLLFGGDEHLPGDIESVLLYVHLVCASSNIDHRASAPLLPAAAPVSGPGVPGVPGVPAGSGPGGHGVLLPRLLRVEPGSARRA